MSKSDEEEANDEEKSSSDVKRKVGGGGGGGGGMWQRMKWSDNMVRLLIMAVYYIGDEAETGAAAGAEKKKGKWKSVSKAMMEKGFCVSPQQCEDKFNDLNKRYKRVNDILGRGTACNVVENHSLLETMRIEPKLKDEVKKLLNSKHLFFREMCAYHSTNTLTHQAAQQQQLSNPSCSHPTLAHNGYSVEEEDEDEEEEEEEDEEEEEEEGEEGGVRRKRARTRMGGVSGNGGKAGLEQWNGKVMGVLEDGSKSRWEKKHWVMTQMVELEENGVRIQREALELENERLKWIKFSSKKEREMERMKIDNEKKRLENASMLLLLRRKEIDFLDVAHPTSFKSHLHITNPLL